MRALCWHGKEKVQVDTVPDPKILNPRDAIIKITSTAICGSNLHLNDGYVKAMEAGNILGHEFMGEAAFGNHHASRFVGGCPLGLPHIPR